MQYGKRLIFFCFVLFFSVQLYGQSPAYADITGLWTGTMYNDTTELYYRYEIAISEKKGKLSGFSHTYFILNDKQYHGVKKIKIKREGNEIITQDLELIANNYPIKPPKGVYVINTLRFEILEDKMIMSGNFETNRTKEYAPATGFIKVERKNNFWQSALVPHLEELGLAKNLSFVEEAEEKKYQTTLAAATVTTTGPVAKPKPAEVVKTEPIKTESLPAAKKEEPVVRNVESVVKKEESKVKIDEPVVKKDLPVAKPKPVETVKAAPVKKADPVVVKSKPVDVAKTVPVKTEPVAATPKPVEVVKAEPAKLKEPEAVKQKQNTFADAAVDIENRKIETIDAVYYKTDSLELTLYDNGEVDGDTVSVLMNGEVIMPRVGLSTNAVRKKISTVNTGDSIQLIMYAENLGSLPPNTGLLIVYDGKDRYEIRFSGDLKKSAAIVFRRKEN